MPFLLPFIFSPFPPYLGHISWYRSRLKAVSWSGLCIILITGHHISGVIFSSSYYPHQRPSKSSSFTQIPVSNPVCHHAHMYLISGAYQGNICCTPALHAWCVHMHMYTPPTSICAPISVHVNPCIDIYLHLMCASICAHRSCSNPMSAPWIVLVCHSRIWFSNLII